MGLRDHLNRDKNTYKGEDQKPDTKAPASTNSQPDVGTMFDIARARASSLSRSPVLNQTSPQQAEDLETDPALVEAASMLEAAERPQATPPNQPSGQRAGAAQAAPASHPDNEHGPDNGQQADSQEEEAQADDDPEEGENLDEHEPARQADVAKAIEDTTTYMDASGRKRRLTAEQLNFCELVAAGGQNYTKAYEESHDCTHLSQKSINEGASKLHRKGYIQARIGWLKERNGRKYQYTAERLKTMAVEKLVSLMDTAEKDEAKLKAIFMLGNMKEHRWWDNTKDTPKEADPTTMKPTDFRAKLAEFATRPR